MSLLLIGACRGRPVDQAFKIACSPPTPNAAGAAAARAAAAASIVTAWNSGDHILDECMNLATDLCDSAHNQTPLRSTGKVARSIDATVFAGAVLDAAKQLEPKLPLGPEFELFWQRLGGVAAAAAQEADSNGRLEEACSLVEAGPLRWQNEGYWQLHPNHDAFASMLLARNGQEQEAIRRLESRSDLGPVPEQILQQLKAGKRK